MFLAASAAVYHVATLAAGSSDSSGSDSSHDWVSYLLQGGPFALILALILLDKLAPTGERDRLRKENAEYKENNQKLNDKLLEVLPPLIDATQVITKVGDMIESMEKTARHDIVTRDRDR